MKKKKELTPLEKTLSDNFLVKVIKVLNLSEDFKFTNLTMHTEINISDEQKEELKHLCRENKDARIDFNSKHGPAKGMNINWSYDLLDIYFNLRISEH